MDALYLSAAIGSTLFSILAFQSSKSHGLKSWLLTFLAMLFAIFAGVYFMLFIGEVVRWLILIQSGGSTSTLMLT